MSVSASVVEITPDMAKRWRALGKNFRGIDEKIVRQIAGDILAGRWELNGQPIILNGTGEVKDGQHRLRAIEVAGRPVKCLVVRGVHEEESIDSGRCRSLADHLKFKGYKYASIMAIAANWALRLGDYGTTLRQNRAPTIRACLEFIAMNPQIERSCAMCGLTRDSKILASSGLIAGLHLIFSGKDSELADRFVRALYVGGGGVELAAGDTMNLLRSRLIESRVSKIKQMSSLYKAALVIKTWNSWRSGDHVQNLKWIASGPRAEDFPSIE